MPKFILAHRHTSRIELCSIDGRNDVKQHCSALPKIPDIYELVRLFTRIETSNLGFLDPSSSPK